MKVAVLLSGGIDSAVSCLLLMKQGFDITGLTMINRDVAVADKAAQVARQIGIEHQIVDLREEFAARVITPFCDEYQRGITPNPCVECNQFIKFGQLLDYAIENGFDRVATGHYAQIDYNEAKHRYLLKKGVDYKKDQSYFLYRLGQKQLSRILFPLENLTKDEVKEIAADQGLQVANEKESQEICFITGDYRDFLSARITSLSGDIIDKQGHIIGKHNGLAYYTIGQRHGLGVNAGKKVYVIEIDVSRNLLVVDEEPYLFSRELMAAQNNLISVENLEAPLHVEAKIRYAAAPAPAIITPVGDKVQVLFDQPQRAITPGQSVVYYQGETVIGGGRII